MHIPSSQVTAGVKIVSDTESVIDSRSSSYMLVSNISCGASCAARVDLIAILATKIASEECGSAAGRVSEI